MCNILRPGIQKAGGKVGVTGDIFSAPHACKSRPTLWYQCEAWRFGDGAERASIFSTIIRFESDASWTATHLPRQSQVAGLFQHEPRLQTLISQSNAQSLKLHRIK